MKKLALLLLLTSCEGTLSFNPFPNKGSSSAHAYIEFPPELPCQAYIESTKAAKSAYLSDEKGYFGEDM